MARHKKSHRPFRASLTELLGFGAGAYVSATNGLTHPIMGYNPELTVNDLINGITGIDTVASAAQGTLAFNPAKLAEFWVPSAAGILIAKVMRHFRVNVNLSRHWKLF